MTSCTSKFEAMPLMEKDEEWEDPDDLVLGPLNSVLENMKYNSRTVSRSELWKVILFASTLSFVAGVTVPYLFYSLIFHHCTSDTFHTKTFEGISEKIFSEINEDGLKLWQRKLDELNSSTLPLYIKEEWERQGIDKVTIVSHNVVFSLPSKKKSNKLQIIKKDVEGDEFEGSASVVDGDSNFIKPLCCASIIGTSHPIEGDLLFANFGRYEDFLKLSQLKIDINGKIIMMKYGMVPTASKVLLAQKFGAMGVILFPEKPLEIKNPKTVNASCNIFLSANETMNFCPSSESQFLFRKIEYPVIPVYPITKEDAKKLLRNLTGLNQPAEWNSRESSPYKVGPGFIDKYRKIRMEIYEEEISLPAYSTIGKIQGKLEPDRSIIVGSSSQSKNFTGFSALLGISDIFARSFKNGTQPRRSILFCVWGTADYFGTYSINEWIKDHQEYLGAEAVAYIDVTSLSAENYQLIGTPMILKEISEAMQKVLAQKEYNMNKMVAKQSNTSLNDHIKSRFQLINTGEHMPFYNQLGIPSAYLKYCKLVSPYQDMTDCNNNEVFIEEFRNIKILAQVWAKVIHSLSHTAILNLDVTGLAVYLTNSVKDLQLKYEKLLEEGSISLSPLNKSIEEFAIAAEHFQNNFKNADIKNFYITRNLNDKLMRIGRSLVGISFTSNTMFRKSLLYGSSSVIACSMVVFPEVTDLLLELSMNSNIKQLQIYEDLHKHLASITSHVTSTTKILYNVI